MSRPTGGQGVHHIASKATICQQLLYFATPLAQLSLLLTAIPAHTKVLNQPMHSMRQLLRIDT
jgi:hypothetical protein